MGNIFTVDSRFSQVMLKVSKLIVLNILWIFTCIPVVTVGTASTALYYCLMKFVQQRDVDPLRDYFRAFRANFRQSFPVWLAILAVSLVLAVNGSILGTSGIPAKGVIYTVGGFTGLLTMMIGIYYFPLLAKFENTTLGLLKFSLFLGMRHLLYTAGLAGILLLAVFLCTGIPRMLPFWALIGFSLTGLACTQLLLKIFRLYGDKRQEEGAGEEELGEKDS